MNAPLDAIDGAALRSLLLASRRLPAAARDFVQDQAGMFSPATVAQLNERIGELQRADRQGDRRRHDAVAERMRRCRAPPNAAFSQQSVNGVLIFIARDDRRDIIVPDRAGVASGLVYARRAALDPHRDGGAVSRRELRRRHHRRSRRPFSTSIAPISAACSSARIERVERRRPARAARFDQRSTHLDVLVDRHRGRRLSDLALDSARALGAALLRRLAGSAAQAGPAGRTRLRTRLRPRLRIRRRRKLLERIARRSRRRVARQRAVPRRRWNRAAQAGQIPADTGGGWGAAIPAVGRAIAGQADMGGASGGDWSGGGFGGDAGGGGDFGGGGGDSGGGW